MAATTTLSLTPSLAFSFSSSSSCAFITGGNHQRFASVTSFSPSSPYFSFKFKRRASTHRFGHVVNASRDYYATLGVSNSASNKEIKAAYRKLARQIMSQTSVATGTSVFSAYSSYGCSQWLNSNPTTKRFMGSGFVIGTVKLLSTASLTRLKVSSLIRTLNSSQEEEVETSNVDDTYGVSQDDINFLWKLGLGSVAGAALIKYGSILFPDVTRPNLSLALLIILTPVIVAIILLIKAE